MTSLHATSRFEPSGELGTAVIVMAVLCIVEQWTIRPATVLLVANGSPEAFAAYIFVLVLGLLVWIATFVLVGVWLGKARRNADRIAPGQQCLSAIWVWLGWIVPIVSWWFPKLVVDDIWRNTVRNPGEPRTDWWWGLVIAGAVLRLITLPVATDLDSVGWVCYGLVSAMTTAAGVFWISVVRTISDAQDALAGPADPHQI